MQLGGRLATFTTHSEFVDISKLSSIARPSGPWLGARLKHSQEGRRVAVRKDAQKDWYWESDPSTPCDLKPEFWEKGEPNNYKNYFEDFLQIQSSFLNDLYSMAKPNSFVLETGHWYQVLEIPDRIVSWDDAMADAQRRNGYLATINSDLEFQFVKELLPEHRAWLGG